MYYLQFYADVFISSGTNIRSYEEVYEPEEYEEVYEPEEYEEVYEAEEYEEEYTLKDSVRRTAAIWIQRHFRCYLQNKHRAATIIQAWWTAISFRQHGATYRNSILRFSSEIEKLKEK